MLIDTLLIFRKTTIITKILHLSPNNITSPLPCKSKLFKADLGLGDFIFYIHTLTHTYVYVYVYVYAYIEETKT